MSPLSLACPWESDMGGIMTVPVLKTCAWSWNGRYKETPNAPQNRRPGQRQEKSRFFFWVLEADFLLSAFALAFSFALPFVVVFVQVLAPFQGMEFPGAGLYPQTLGQCAPAFSLMGPVLFHHLGCGAA